MSALSPAFSTFRLNPVVTERLRQLQTQNPSAKLIVLYNPVSMSVVYIKRDGYDEGITCTSPVALEVARQSFAKMAVAIAGGTDFAVFDEFVPAKIPAADRN